MLGKKASRREAIFFYSIFYIMLLLFILSPFLYAYSIISSNTLIYLSSALFSLMLPFGAVSYMLHKGFTNKKIASSLGFVNRQGILKLISIGVVLFITIFVLEIAVGEISQITNVQINTNVGLLLNNAPLWFIIFVAFIGPIDEEIFFRGFLVPRIGILWSSLLFALLHAGYGSSFGIEIIAAFIFGILAGYVFKKSKSLYPSITAHMLVNILAVVGVMF